MTFVLGITGRMGSGKSHAIHQFIRAFTEMNRVATPVFIDDIRRSIQPKMPGMDFDSFWTMAGKEIRETAARQIENAGDYALVEWPRLIEDGFLEILDAVVIIDCTPDIRQQRLQNGDLPWPEIQTRLNRQMTVQDIEKKLTLRHWLFDSSTDPGFDAYQELCRRIDDELQ